VTIYAQVDVVNRGYSGYNTRWANHLLDKIFPNSQENTQLVTLFWGANDAALPERNRYCTLLIHRPLQLFQTDLDWNLNWLHVQVTYMLWHCCSRLHQATLVCLSHLSMWVQCTATRTCARVQAEPESHGGTLALIWCGCYCPYCPASSVRARQDQT